MRVSNKYILKLITLLFYLVILLLNFSCRKLIAVGNPSDLLNSPSVFSSDQSAISSISGLYSQIISTNSFLNGGMTIYTGMTSDELYNTTPGPDDQFSENIISPTSSVVSNNFWASGYNFIYTCNAILDGLNKSTQVTIQTKKTLIGESKFIRALTYFYLVNIFGDVPIITTTTYQESSVTPRSPVNSVYQQIISDLLDADSLLSIDYPSSDRVRPNKYAVSALLARVYLYTKDYSKAESFSSQVIDAGVYHLSTNLNDVFKQGSEEAIWQLQPNSLTMDVYEGNVLIPADNSVPQYAITSFLLNSFENGDQRKTNWLMSSSINNITYWYPFKYKIRTGSSLNEYYMVLRLAELYLIRAEARTEENDFSGAESDLNMIRSRAGLPNTTANDQPSLLAAIKQERRVEFFAEWGHRWLDLKRTNTADSILNSIKAPNWKESDTLFPIPESQININGLLTQNPGY